jgi:hypothetical protein
MGGVGSGAHNRTTRRVVEDCECLSVRILRRRRLLPEPGCADAASEHILSVDGVRLRLSATDQPGGGLRWWVHCAQCDRRASKLHRPDPTQPWRCRRCWDLGYRSRRENRVDWLLRRAGRLRWPLMMEAVSSASPSVRAQEFAKPKRMRWATYHRILDLADECDARAVMHGFDRLRRLTSER